MIKKIGPWSLIDAAILSASAASAIGAKFFSSWAIGFISALLILLAILGMRSQTKKDVPEIGG